MEKIIGNRLYNTNDLTLIAQWETQDRSQSETMYFSEEGGYLLHCEGANAVFSNEYGTNSFSQEDLLILEEDDVYGWLEVHAPRQYEKLFAEPELTHSA